MPGQLARHEKKAQPLASVIDKVFQQIFQRTWPLSPNLHEKSRYFLSTRISDLFRGFSPTSVSAGRSDGTVCRDAAWRPVHPNRRSRQRLSSVSRSSRTHRQVATARQPCGLPEVICSDPSPNFQFRSTSMSSHAGKDTSSSNIRQ